MRALHPFVCSSAIEVYIMCCRAFAGGHAALTERMSSLRETLQMQKPVPLNAICER
jgi:hypothetical protein